jgi:excisionase family DNA binding protein
MPVRPTAWQGLERLRKPSTTLRSPSRSVSKACYPNPPNGAYGKPFAEQVAADLRRTDLVRSDYLLPVSSVAQRLGVSVATVHKAINEGRLRCHLLGCVRRISPEDLDGYIRGQAARQPPTDEDWRTVKDLMQAAAVSRSQAYRLLERGLVPFKVFAGVRYIRNEDIAAVAQSRIPSSSGRGRPAP